MREKYIKTPLQAYMLLKQITVKEMAQALKMNERNLYRILNAQVRPSKNTALKIFTYVKADVPFEMIRPKIEIPVCKCCGRIIGPNLEKKMKAMEKKKNKEKQK